MNALRSTFLRVVLEQLKRGVVYGWGRRDEHVMDCSGFVTVALHEAGGPDWRATHNTDELWKLPRVESVADLLPGDLCLYWGEHSTGPGDVEHVMVYVGAGICVGMAWGGKADVDPTVSRAQGHTVKVLPVKYRGDLAGFRRLPLAV